MAGSRVAQHYVQVVGTPDASTELRVRRLYAEVLLTPSGVTVHNETVNQSLNITDAGIGRVEAQDVASTLNLQQQINLTYEKTANSIMLFSQQAGQAKDGVATQNISFTQAMVYFNYVGDRTPVEHTLNFTQCATTLQTIVVSQDLGITDSVSYDYPTKPAITQFMGLYQHVSTPYHMWVEHTLGFTQLGSVPVDLTITDTINFVQQASMEDAWQTLGLSDAAIAGRGYWISQNIALTDTHERVGFWVRSVSHDLGITDALTYYDDSPCNFKNYSPFQGEGAAPREALQDPQGSLSDRLSLYQPAIGARSSELILRAPEMDNRDRNAYNRVQGETRGGKLRIYRDPTWPAVRTLAVTIIGLTEAQVDEYQTFVANTLGQKIGLTDWEGRLWEGIITNPDEDATQDGKARWTVTFEFEGEMLTHEAPGSEDGDGMAMNLSQSVSAVIV
jgi:hypothetical protein